MIVTVRLPTPLRSYVDGQRDVKLTGSTLDAVLHELVRDRAELGRHLLDERGELRRFVNCFLNDEDVRNLGGTRVPVHDGDVITIVPAIAGGAHG